MLNYIPRCEKGGGLIGTWHHFSFTMWTSSRIAAIGLIEFIVNFSDFSRNISTPFMSWNQLGANRTLDGSHT